MNHRVLSFVLAIVLFVVASPLGSAATPPPAELLNAGRVDEAIDALRARINAAPNDAEAHGLLMRAYYAVQQWDDAIAAGQRAVELAPNNASFHLWLGRAYGSKADHSSWTAAISLAKKTRVEFERAVQLDGKSLEARSDLAEFYVSAPGFLGGGKDKALEQAKQAVKLGDEATAHWIEGKIAESDKNFGAAEQQYHFAIEKSKGDPKYVLNLASFYRTRGRMAEVEATVMQALKSIRPDHGSAMYDAAELLYRAGRNFNSAVDLLRRYIASPQHAEDAPVFQAHYLLGTILEKMGNKTAAAEQYRSALLLARNYEPAQTALKRLQ